MLAKATSCAVVGLEGALVDVEVDIGGGQVGFWKVVSETHTKYPAHMSGMEGLATILRSSEQGIYDRVGAELEDGDSQDCYPGAFLRF